MNGFERNATAAERALWDYLTVRAWPDGNVSLLYRWEDEIAARQPAAPPEPLDEKERHLRQRWAAAALAAKCAELLRWRERGEIPLSVTDELREALRAFGGAMGNSPARSISHWGMFHDAA